MSKKKILIIILIFFLCAVSIGIYFSNKLSLPQNIKDIITYEYTVLDYQKMKAFVDKSDHLVILEFDNNDEYFSQINQIENLSHYKTMPENKLDSLMPPKMFESISNDYINNYYFQDKNSMIMFILLTNNRIAIFYY